MIPRRGLRAMAVLVLEDGLERRAAQCGASPTEVVRALEWIDGMLRARGELGVFLCVPKPVSGLAADSSARPVDSGRDVPL